MLTIIEKTIIAVALGLVVLSSRSKCCDEVNIFDEEALQRFNSENVEEKAVKFVLEKMVSRSFVANNSYLLSYVHILRLFDKMMADNDELDMNSWLHLKEYLDFRSGALLQSFLRHVVMRIRSVTQASSNSSFIGFANRYLKLATCIHNYETSDLPSCYYVVGKVQWNLDILQHLQSALLTVIKDLSSQDFNLLRDYQMYERMGILCGVLDESIRTALTVGHQKLRQSLTTNAKSSSTWMVNDSARRFNLKAVCSTAEETAMQKYLADMESSILSNIAIAMDRCAALPLVVSFLRDIATSIELL